ncbi:SHOCT domain-containing protein [Rhodococcus koreensis]|uniref:SHOCT domain-containing protein n=1 Tax=Rhodococcus koreensis TaxID=99653 RepID=UPI0036DD7E1D
MYDYEPGWGWGYALMFVGMALFWGLLVLGIGVLVHYVGHNASMPSAHPPSALHEAEKLLAERFARGEIDETEYRERLATLRTHGPP